MASLDFLEGEAEHAKQRRLLSGWSGTLCFFALLFQGFCVSVSVSVSVCLCVCVSVCLCNCVIV
jgi:hypothetical protein